jgi:cephalosporin hydroxylase
MPGTDLARFQAFDARDQRSAAVSPELWRTVQCAKQGRDGKACVSWRGVPLLKDPLDMALYPMLLWELRPATIIELGAFAGGSALWLADMATTFDLSARILSLDLNLDQVQVQDPRIEFVRADFADVGTSGLPLPLGTLTHPWLVIEDAHVNLVGVLEYLDQHMTEGDYLIVEDTVWPRKHRFLGQFMESRGFRYGVDTRYADQFGYNGTWNWNAILRCNRRRDGPSRR